MDIKLLIIIVLPISLVLIGLLINYYIKEKEKKELIILLSKLDMSNIIDKQKSKNKDEKSLKLIQAGITRKEYNEAKLLFGLAGFILMITLPFFFSWKIGLAGGIVGLLLIIFSGKIYLLIAKSERQEKINKDLGTFLDLVNVILEAGGSLKNAFFVVSQKGNKIIDEELLKEVAILEYEMTNYSTKQAYENLKERVDSIEMDKIVDFLILSEETGIGVKNVFTSQSEELRENKFFKMKGKISTLNMYLMIVIFVFVLPAIGAFIAFPMRSGAIATGL